MNNGNEGYEDEPDEDKEYDSDMIPEAGVVDEDLLEENMQFRHEKQLNRQYQLELEDAYDEASETIARQQARIQALEKKLKEEEKLRESRLEHIKLSEQLEQELAKKQAELEKTRAHLKNTTSELEEISKRSTQVRDDSSAESSAPPKVEEDVRSHEESVLRQESMLDMELLRRQNEEMQRLRDLLDEQVWKANQLEAQLRSSAGYGNGDGSMGGSLADELGMAFSLEAELSLTQTSAPDKKGNNHHLPTPQPPDLSSEKDAQLAEMAQKLREFQEQMEAERLKRIQAELLASERADAERLAQEQAEKLRKEKEEFELNTRAELDRLKRVSAIEPKDTPSLVEPLSPTPVVVGLPLSISTSSNPFSSPLLESPAMTTSLPNPFSLGPKPTNSNRSSSTSPLPELNPFSAEFVSATSTRNPETTNFEIIENLDIIPLNESKPTLSTLVVAPNAPIGVIISPSQARNPFGNPFSSFPPNVQNTTNNNDNSTVNNINYVYSPTIINNTTVVNIPAPTQPPFPSSKNSTTPESSRPNPSESPIPGGSGASTPTDKKAHRMSQSFANRKAALLSQKREPAPENGGGKELATPSHPQNQSLHEQRLRAQAGLDQVKATQEHLLKKKLLLEQMMAAQKGSSPPPQPPPQQNPKGPSSSTQSLPGDPTIRNTDSGPRSRPHGSTVPQPTLVPMKKNASQPQKLPPQQDRAPPLLDDMPVEVGTIIICECPYCYKKMKGPLGKEVRCPFCGRILRVTALGHNPSFGRGTNEFAISLPSQERIFPIYIEESPDAEKYLGYRLTQSVTYHLKVVPSSIAVLSNAKPIVMEWPLKYIKRILVEDNRLVVIAWMAGIRKSKTFKFRTVGLKVDAVYDFVEKAIRAYTEKLDVDLAREMQKEEMLELVENNDFLKELRFNEVFNQILAKETKNGFDELKGLTDSNYKLVIANMGAESYRKAKEIANSSKAVKQDKKAKKKRAPKSFENPSLAADVEAFFTKPNEEPEPQPSMRSDSQHSVLLDQDTLGGMEHKSLSDIIALKQKGSGTALLSS